eukprot:380031-Alexandrium_andersonii.AAC.1
MPSSNSSGSPPQLPASACRSAPRPGVAGEAGREGLGPGLCFAAATGIHFCPAPYAPGGGSRGPSGPTAGREG